MNSDLPLNDIQFNAAKRVQSILSEPACPDLNLRCEELYDCLNARDAIVIFSNFNPETDLSPESLSVYKIMNERYQFCERRLLCYLSNGLHGFVEPGNVLDSILDIEDVVMLIMGAVHEIPLPVQYKAMIDNEKIDVTKNNTIKTILSFDDGWTAILKKMVSILRFKDNNVMHDLLRFVESELEKMTDMFSDDPEIQLMLDEAYKNEAALKKLRSECEVLEAKKKEYACVVCHENPHDVVFRSCRMCCVCQSCFEKIKKTAQNNRQPMRCPMCQKEVKNPILLTNWQPKVHGKVIYSKSSMKDVFSLLASLQTHA